MIPGLARQPLEEAAQAALRKAGEAALLEAAEAAEPAEPAPRDLSTPRQTSGRSSTSPRLFV